MRKVSRLGVALRFVGAAAAPAWHWFASIRTPGGLVLSNTRAAASWSWQLSGSTRSWCAQSPCGAWRRLRCFCVSEIGDRLGGTVFALDLNAPASLCQAANSVPLAWRSVAPAFVAFSLAWAMRAGSMSMRDGKARPFTQEGERAAKDTVQVAVAARISNQPCSHSTPISARINCN